MKKITLLFVSLCIAVVSNAQTTFDLDWEQGVNGATASFTIEPGDTMRWTWSNGAPHSVTSEGGSAETFDSGIITGNGTEYSYTFTTVGSNPYLCIVHPSTMFGTITVEETMGVEEKFARNVQISPNPVTDEMTITSLIPFDMYQIYDMTGKLVGQGKGSGTFTHLNTSYLKTGMYFMNVTAGKMQATVKLMKK
ncbi:MAG: T9SS type A sorting domain-containing protein [Marinirhabdus sp.]